MKLRPVESEMLLAAGYDDKSRILQVVFRTGETYRYKNVPSAEYDGLMSAESRVSTCTNTSLGVMITSGSRQDFHDLRRINIDILYIRENPVILLNLYLTEDAMEINDLTYKVIGCAYKVHNVLGPGFLEKVYENALKLELEKLGIEVRQQGKLPVWYEGHQLACTFLILDR